MAAARWIEYTYLAHFSRPTPVRNLYRLVKRHRICRIVELGIADVLRSASLLRVAQRFAGESQVAYAGLDWFDARPNSQPRLMLKDAYRTLRATGASVRLLPGEPGTTLVAAANSLQHTGLVLIGPTTTDDSLAPAWFYLPRMLDEASIVLSEARGANDEPSFTRVSADDITRRAGRNSVPLAA